MNYEMRDADDMSREELQTALKGWGRLATGTNAALRERYTTEHDKRSQRQQQQQQQQGTMITFSSSLTTELPFPVCLSVAATSAAARTTIPSAPASQKPGNSTTKASSSTTSNTKKKSPVEKRLKRYRSSCPAAVQQRINRAITQRLYLVKRGEIIQHQQQPLPGSSCVSCEFVVLGSTGNVYTVTIQKIPNCTCPDHGKGNLCKHILFVLLKVMSLDPNSPLIFQAAWIESELHFMFEQFQIRLHSVSGASSAASTVLANERVRATFTKLETGQDESNLEDTTTNVARRAVEEDDCPICFESMSPSEATTFCRASCGANFHKKCIQAWVQQHRSKPTCPMCRGPWEDATSNSKKGAKKFQSDEGFTNLGTLQGQSPVRDTSSYSTWSPYSNKRRRRW